MKNGTLPCKENQEHRLQHSIEAWAYDPRKPLPFYDTPARRQQTQGVCSFLPAEKVFIIALAVGHYWG